MLSDGCLIQNAETTWGSSQRAFYTEKHCSSHLHISTPLSPMPFCQLRTQHLSLLSRLQSSHFFKSLFGFFNPALLLLQQYRKSPLSQHPSFEPQQPSCMSKCKCTSDPAASNKISNFLKALQGSSLEETSLISHFTSNKINEETAQPIVLCQVLPLREQLLNHRQVRLTLSYRTEKFFRLSSSLIDGFQHLTLYRMFLSSL